MDTADKLILFTFLAFIMGLIYFTLLTEISTNKKIEKLISIMEIQT